MPRSGALVLLVCVTLLAACDDENATVLRGTFVEDGAPGEFFIRGNATQRLKCVYNGTDDNTPLSGAMFEYPLIGGGEIRGPGGWRVIFVQAEAERVQMTVQDQSGAPNAELSQRMRSRLDACGWT